MKINISTPAPLTTPYLEKMDKSSPWSVYPRPQMVRDSFFSLNGAWDFSECKGKSAPEYRESILVPFPPESILSGIGRRMGRGSRLYYRKRFTLPKGFVKDRIILNLGAVDCICRVFINGECVCHNEGGYLPFSADITELYRAGENEIVLEVRDGTNKKYPYGKQKEKRGGMWYTPVSGVWQSVWIESTSRDAITSMIISQTMRDAKIRIKTTAENPKLIFEGEEYAFVGGEVTITPKDARMWSPEDPCLYYFDIKTDGDLVRGYFALREIGTVTASDGRCRTTLNGKPYFFSGLLDQGYFPDGIFLPATPEGYEEDILRAKRMGFNMLRKHIKVEPLIFYHLCDRLGMVVFQDMVNCGSYSFFWDTAIPTVGGKFAFSSLRNSSRRARDNFETCAIGTMAHLESTPSVLQYTIFNEGWGQFSADKEYEKLSSLDRSRLFDTTSGWFAGTLSDFDSRHVYFRIPTVKRPTGKPYFISEFGGYSHRVEGHLFGTANYGYSSYKTKDELYEAIRSLYIDGILPLIKEGVCALVYTQLTDVEDETNGLITYDRRVVKVPEEGMREINEMLYSEFSAIEK